MNCATRLADILTQWAPGSGAIPWEQRGGNRDDNGLATGRAVADAMWLAVDVDQSLQGLKALGEDVTHFEEHLPSWYQAVLSVQEPWLSGSNSGIALNASSMAVLRALGTVLNRARPEIELSQTDREELADLLTDATTLLNDTTEIPEAERIRLLALIQAARQTLGHLDVTGTDELRAEVSRIALSLGSSSLHVADTEKKGRMHNLAKAMLHRVDVATTAAGTAAAVTGATDIVQAITQGTGHS